MTAQELHKRAMEAAQAADAARCAQDEARAGHLFFDAFRWEREAARLVEIEPSRSILYRSAATLAMDCGLAAEALQLVREASMGDPPAAVAVELREVEGRAQLALGRLHRQAS